MSYLDLPPGYEEAYFKTLQPGDRFQFSRVRVKDIFLSRARVKNITFRSQFLSLAPVWDEFTTEQKDAWAAAGAVVGLDGWKAFVRDTTQRRKAGLSGYATPSPLYSGNVGRMVIESPATSMRLVQAHPNVYYVLRKVSGTKSQYSPVPVYERITLPLAITVSWSTELTAAGANPSARFFCVLYSSYQGRTLQTEVEIPFGLTDSWSRSTATIYDVPGLLRGYSAFVEVIDARGTLYFDAPILLHTGENWARDPRCDNIGQGFTKAFYQVARSWIAEDPVEGTDYGSWYYGA